MGAVTNRENSMAGTATRAVSGLGLAEGGGDGMKSHASTMLMANRRGAQRHGNIAVGDQGSDQRAQDRLHNGAGAQQR